MPSPMPICLRCNCVLAAWPAQQPKVGSGPWFACFRSHKACTALLIMQRQTTLEAAQQEHASASHSRSLLSRSLQVLQAWPDLLRHAAATPQSAPLLPTMQHPPLPHKKVDTHRVIKKITSYNMTPWIWTGSSGEARCFQARCRGAGLCGWQGRSGHAPVGLVQRAPASGRGQLAAGSHQRAAA